MIFNMTLRREMKFNSILNIDNIVFAEVPLFTFVLIVLTMCVWCTIWYVNRLFAFLMHWQQEIQYIWMYLNNVSSFAVVMHFCQNLADCDAGGGVVVFVGCRFSSSAGANIQPNNAAFANLRLELGIQNFLLLTQLSKFLILVNMDLWAREFSIIWPMVNYHCWQGNCFYRFYIYHSICWCALKILQCAKSSSYNKPIITFWIECVCVLFCCRHLWWNSLYAFNPDKYEPITSILPYHSQPMQFLQPRTFQPFGFVWVNCLFVLLMFSHAAHFISIQLELFVYHLSWKRSSIENHLLPLQWFPLNTTLNLVEN